MKQILGCGIVALLTLALATIPVVGIWCYEQKVKAYESRMGTSCDPEDFREGVASIGYYYHQAATLLTFSFTNEDESTRWSLSPGLFLVGLSLATISIALLIGYWTIGKILRTSRSGA
jgi:hypothetical protein